MTMTEFSVMTTPEIYIEPRVDGFYWFLIGEFNSHVLNQGKAKTYKTALKHGQEALYAYLETVST
jgi:hypothetical protein